MPEGQVAMRSGPVVYDSIIFAKVEATTAVSIRIPMATITMMQKMSMAKGTITVAIVRSKTNTRAHDKNAQSNNSNNKNNMAIILYDDSWPVRNTSSHGTILLRSNMERNSSTVVSIAL